ncbi:hypothetical protein Barb4_03137 [Bacteroidales bacterium Barb4]|nr:hypothetical protein Barb4_03137 [Bacteroidales bacterium Barb4]
MIYKHIIFCILSSFQDFLDCVIFNPTFRFAACGAEISHSFGIYAI